jgi:hypothetical protein
VFIFVDTLRTHLSVYLEVKFQFSKSILIRMMMLETLLDIKLALLYSSADRVYLQLNRAYITLHRTQCSQ